jgi:hypothetical protein
MSDTYSGSPSPDVSIPDTPASSPTEGPEAFGNPVDIAANEAVTEKRHTVLGELAKSENVEQYALERRDEEDAMFRGKDCQKSGCLVSTCLKSTERCCNGGRWSQIKRPAVSGNS